MKRLAHLTKVSLVLTYFSLLSMSVVACHSQDDSTDEINDAFSETSYMAGESNHTSDDNHQYYDGQDMFLAVSNEAEANHETSLSDREESGTQSWQESEAAQRQAIVDVGGGNRLTLYSQRVITKVEGHRARTIVDQVFYSPYNRQLEGTFRYSLPVGASVSHYALYLGRVNGSLNALEESESDQEPLSTEATREILDLTTEALVAQIGQNDEVWGDLRIGRVVSQADGRQAYEDTTRQRVDPALVENVTPNAFQARVFPIQPNGYTRIVFAYDEALARVDDELIYTFPLPEEDIAHLSVQLLVEGHSTPDGERQAEVTSTLPLTPLPAREMSPTDEQESSEETELSNDLRSAWSGRVTGQSPGGAVTIRLPISDTVEVVTGRDGDLQAFSGRVVLNGLNDLAVDTPISNERAIFVLDTSLSSQPTRFGINRTLLAEILTQNSSIQEFAVLSFDLGAEWLTDGFISNTTVNRETVLSQIDQILLEGATRFEAVTTSINSADWINEGTDLFLLSDGSINWGTQAPDQIALAMNKIDRVFAYQTGIGAENLALYRSLTKRGSVFTCLTMESLPACAVAHNTSSLRLVNIRVDGVGHQPAVTSEVAYTHRDNDVFNGVELTFAGQLLIPGQASLRLTLNDGTQDHVLSYPLELLAPHHKTLAPRAWAELLVSLMSTSAQPRLQELIYALSQRFIILTQNVVLLVLETDEEYTEYDLPMIWEDTLNSIDSIISLIENVANAGTLYSPMIEGVLISISPQIEAATGQTLETHLNLLDLALYDLDLPEISYQHRSRQAANYHQGQIEPADYEVYMNEADTLFTRGLDHAAARALSSIIENDNANGVALRLVAYRLNTWGFTGLSAELFTEVLRRRPYEPHSYRDLAHVVRYERPALAALLYEIALNGEWDDRFQQLNVLIGEEYSLFIRQLERSNHPLASRLSSLSTHDHLQSPTDDLRVIMSWNTDNVDIDLWVTNPNGFKCYYAQPETPQGGRLLDDITQGFGPERFALPTASTGSYSIQAHYYGNNGNRLEAETFIHVTIIKYAGTSQEEVEEFDVLLAEVNEVANIANLSF